MSKIVNDILNISGIYTQIFGELAVNEQSKLRYIVIPGNPGCILFYDTFISALFDALGRKFSVIGISHAGHSAVGKNGNRIFSLEEQINHKIEFLNNLADGVYPNHVEGDENEKKNEFTIICHSIGAYILLKAVSKLISTQKIKINKIVMLMPTIKDLYNGFSYFNRIVTSNYTRNLFAYLIDYFPNLTIYLMSFFINEARFKKKIDTIKNHLDYYLILNVTTMAHEEGLKIFKIDDDIAHVLNFYEKKVIFCYSSIDCYTPKDIIEEVKLRWPDAKTFMAPEGVEHAFVIKSSELMAQKVVEYISSMP